MAHLMRMAELSAQSGVPVASIKLYLREGVLPPGERTSPNQALYGEIHVRRLRLIRALREVGDVPLAAIKTIVGALDAQTGSTHEILGMVQQAITAPIDDSARDEVVETMVDEIIAEQGWFTRQNPARDMVVAALSRVIELGGDPAQYRELLSAYARAAEIAARADIAGIARELESDTIVEEAVTWTVLGDTVLSGLRRIAQESGSAKLFRHEECE
ncbi:MerR family transcriptional regulator [Hoyosella altamirensis]|uniref:DNA-binding transcriptional MerR regulator n=1 Tax=Hoyosella altamirensis TaxID=616997 RepID=A0A839RKR1_9ACTN|nr:MerR family transcriptional regulator [Hoyosella altamirensis]MBB3036754.1 DNA-binding transcriptional MerR regulator [Hoyosella altamirensis]